MGNKSERQNRKAGTFRLESGYKSTNIFYKLTKIIYTPTAKQLSGTLSVATELPNEKKLPQAKLNMFDLRQLIRSIRIIRR